MKLEGVLSMVADDPLSEAGFLVGDVNPANIHASSPAGRFHQFRRRLCAVAPPFQKFRPRPSAYSNNRGFLR
jgi:hypothetical protein